MYEKITANIMVGSVNQTLDFYEAVLGFELAMAVPQGSQQIVTTRSDDTPLGFAVIKRDNVELMIQSQKSLSQELPAFANLPIGGTITFYIQVDDVQELYRRIKDKIAVLMDLHTTFYGTREFCIRDCNGYVLTFASRSPETSA
jgi:uncharacterized glyoxalase superfamily protein PhnB